MDFAARLRVEPGEKVNLAERDPAATPGCKGKDKAVADLARDLDRLGRLQYLLYAEGKRSLLVVLQAMDGGGKDGTIRHVMTGLNPQGIQVTAFKQPTDEERAHDFLWRIHKAVPPAGKIGIFNRSHYEDVLVVRVMGLVPRSVWSSRYDQINAFERGLAENHVTILKFFLHISKAEQKRRFEKRMEDPDRQWKLSSSDFEDRKRWDDFQAAYEDAITRCNTPYAPWHIVGADHKWYRNLAVSQIMVETMEAMKMKFPPPAIDLSRVKWR